MMGDLHIFAKTKPFMIYNYVTLNEKLYISSVTYTKFMLLNKYNIKVQVPAQQNTSGWNLIFSQLIFEFSFTYTGITKTNKSNKLNNHFDTNKKLVHLQRHVLV